MNSDLYDIYRACRLCGVGAGYKMPIIQSVINVEEDELELKHKIRECVQIEVNLNDCMPPLICELCVDKILDFYEFRKMCQETNKKTRLRLGLPLTSSQSTLESDSVLAKTESMNSDSDEGEPLSKQVVKTPQPKSADLKTEDLKIKVTDTLLEQMRAALARRLGRARTAEPGEEKPIEIKDSRSPSPSPSAGVGGGGERRETRRRRTPSPRRRTRQRTVEETPFTQLQDSPVVRPRTQPGPKSTVKTRERQKPEERETPILHEEDDDNSLLVPSQKRPREVPVETPPPTKRIKWVEPAKTERTPRPGPKSSKDTPNAAPPQNPPPKAGPKYKKAEIPPPKPQKPETPAPKSKKPELPLSKTRAKGEPSPAPAHKSKQLETVVATSKTKNRDTSSPGPKSKKQLDLTKIPEKTPDKTLRPPERTSEKVPRASEKTSEKTPKASEKASPLACPICGIVAKAAQGFASHMKVHVPSFTPAKQACNACEMWFPSVEAAGAHHKRHATLPLPYSCGRCYDDFRTQADYAIHFLRGQCISTYEAPDVKCDECWKMFPTYKLLEEHRCPGEGGRPGGKCGKCHRSFVSQRGLAAHEMRCTVRKKPGPQPEPESAGGGLPAAQVRLVRCDALLAARAGTYCVRGLPLKFGLDCNCVYPYLPTDEVKPEPADTVDHMVTINDEIKEEYLERDVKDDTLVHWDSDDSDGRDSTTNSVDSLSAISLKTLFSSKCLGKMPKKERKVTSEKRSDSVLSNAFSESTRTSLVDNLIKESNNSDQYDSDSILDKNLGRSDSAELCNTKTKLMEISEEVSVKEVVEMKPDDVNSRPETNKMCDEDNTSELSTKCSDVSRTTNDVHNEENCKSSPKNGRLVSSTIINDDRFVLNEEKFESKNIQSKAKDMDVDIKTSESYSEDTNKFGESNCTETTEQTIEELVPNIEDKIDTKIDSQVSETSTSIDNFKAKDNEPKCHESGDNMNGNEKANDETTENSSYNRDNVMNEKDEPREEKDKTSEEDNSSDVIMPNKDDHSAAISNSTNLENSLENITSKIDDVRNDNEVNAESNLVDPKEILSTDNDILDNVSVQSADKFNINNLDEEDKILMAELDAHIGENQSESNVVSKNTSQHLISENSNEIGENSSAVGDNTKRIKNMEIIGENGDFKNYCGNTSEGFTEKSESLDVLINDQNDLRSLHLDSISEEEFNFDI